MAFISTIDARNLVTATTGERAEERGGAVVIGHVPYTEVRGRSSLHDESRPRPLTPLDEYLSLVRAFPLVSIQDDAHLKEALAAIDVMLNIPARSDAQEAYLAALTDLVETYETAHVTFPSRTGLDALRFLIESNDLKQEDLVPIFGTKSIVSEVLNERRERKLTLDHIKKLAAYFHVSPAVFIDDAPL